MRVCVCVRVCVNKAWSCILRLSTRVDTVSLNQFSWQAEISEGVATEQKKALFSEGQVCRNRAACSIQSPISAGPPGTDSEFGRRIRQGILRSRKFLKNFSTF